MGRRYLPGRWIAGLTYTSLTFFVFWGGLLGSASLALTGRSLESFIGIAVAAVLWTLHVIRVRLRHEAAQLYMQNEYENQRWARRFDFCCYPLSLATLWWALLSVALTRRIRWRQILYHLDRGGKVVRVEREGVSGNLKGSTPIVATPALLQIAPQDSELPRLTLLTEDKHAGVEISVTASNRRAA